MISAGLRASVAAGVTVLLAIACAPLSSYLGHAADTFTLGLVLMVVWPAMVFLGWQPGSGVGLHYAFAFGAQFAYLWGMSFLITGSGAPPGRRLALGAAACAPSILVLVLGYVRVEAPQSFFIAGGAIAAVIGLPWNILYAMGWYAAAEWLGQPAAMGRDWPFLGNALAYGSLFGAFINGVLVAQILAARKSPAQVAQRP